MACGSACRLDGGQSISRASASQTSAVDTHASHCAASSACGRCGTLWEPPTSMTSVTHPYSWSDCAACHASAGSSPALEAQKRSMAALWHITLPSTWRRTAQQAGWFAQGPLILVGCSYELPVDVTQPVVVRAPGHVLQEASTYFQNGQLAHGHGGFELCPRLACDALVLHGHRHEVIMSLR
jgi:hypothetical protein